MNNSHYIYRKNKYETYFKTTVGTYAEIVEDSYHLLHWTRINNINKSIKN